jgi:hypothetical protein
MYVRMVQSLKINLIQSIQAKKKNNMVIPVNVKEAFDKILNPFMIKIK